MARRLSDWGENRYSQDGEDGMIDEILQRIGPGDRRAVEFGANDGYSCSNTCIRWVAEGWEAILAEGDPHIWHSLERVNQTEQAQAGRVHAFKAKIKPTGNQERTPEMLHTTIDDLITDVGWDTVDLMSIDIDGADYLIWQAMAIQPRILVIEYNRSVPPNYALWQPDVGGKFGASAKALVTLGIDKGYHLVGLTNANLLFVKDEYRDEFGDLVTDLDKLFLYDDLAYLVTDMFGNTAVLGNPPWGVQGAYVGTLVGAPGAPLPHSLPELSGTVEALREAYARVYGNPIFIDNDWHNVSDQSSPAPEELTKLLKLRHPLVLIDISWHPPSTDYSWIERTAIEGRYLYRRDANLLVSLVYRGKPS